jgi:hypothetical protein
MSPRSLSQPRSACWPSASPRRGLRGASARVDRRSQSIRSVPFSSSPPPAMPGAPTICEASSRMPAWLATGANRRRRATPLNEGPSLAGRRPSIATHLLTRRKPTFAQRRTPAIATSSPKNYRSGPRKREARCGLDWCPSSPKAAWANVTKASPDENCTALVGSAQSGSMAQTVRRRRAIPRIVRPKPRSDSIAGSGTPTPPPPPEQPVELAHSTSTLSRPI